MDIKIKDGFEQLAKERENLTKVLNDKGDIGTKRLKWWPLFNTTCVIAENYQSDVRKKLKLDIALSYLNDAKCEMKQYGITHDDFLKVEQALNSAINIIGKLVMEKYKLTVSEGRKGYGSTPELKN